MDPRKASAPDTVRTVTEGRESEQPAGRLASTNSLNHRRAQGWGRARVSGQCASEQPARPRVKPDLRSNQPLVIVVEPVGHRGRFRAGLDGRVLVASSRTPFCDAARVLLADGVAPPTRIVLRHANSATDALTATMAVAAKLTVEDGDDSPGFRKWRPLLKAPSRWEGAPRIAPNDAATTLASGGDNAQARKIIGEPAGVAPQRQHDALPADSLRRKPTPPRLAFTGSVIDRLDGLVAHERSAS
jgi:hypothetical protein